MLSARTRPGDGVWWCTLLDADSSQWLNDLTAFKAACEDTYTADGTYKRMCVIGHRLGLRAGLGNVLRRHPHPAEPTPDRSLDRKAACMRTISGLLPVSSLPELCREFTSWVPPPG